MVFLLFFAVFFGLAWLGWLVGGWVGGSGVGGWGGREWVEWMDGGSGSLCFWRGEGWVRGWRACGGSGGVGVGIDCWGGKGDVCLEWVDLGFVNIRNTVLGLINETLSNAN